MPHLDITHIVLDLLLMLGAGFVAALICRRLHLSMLIGYIVVGAVIGGGGLKFISDSNHEIELLAEIGVLFLLFTIGLEFSFDDMRDTARQLFVGGPIQMFAVAIPTFAFMYFVADWPGKKAAIVAFALSMSSTVLVFKALADSGQSTKPAGRRAINILLFQDMALVPLLLLIPLLTGSGEQAGPWRYAALGLATVGLFGGVLLCRKIIRLFIVPYLAAQRSRELVMLFSLVVLLGVCFLTDMIGLPAPLGALAAGLALGGTRLSHQIDALMLSFREAFAALFFVGLGLLFRPQVLIEQPVFMVLAFVSILVIKTLAGAAAARVTGLTTKAALGVGLGISQVGEFAFVLSFTAMEAKVIPRESYQTILVLALGSLMITPRMIKIGLRWSSGALEPAASRAEQAHLRPTSDRGAIVVGIGPVGRNIAQRLKGLYARVVAIDLSPVNLHELAQEGIDTLNGDATRQETLIKAGIREACHAFVCVPNDAVARQIVLLCRKLNPTCDVIVRCRFIESVSLLKAAGATLVVSEEGQSAQALMNELSRLTAESTT